MNKNATFFNNFIIFLNPLPNSTLLKLHASYHLYEEIEGPFPSIRNSWDVQIPFSIYSLLSQEQYQEGGNTNFLGIFKSYCAPHTFSRESLQLNRSFI